MTGPAHNRGPGRISRRRLLTWGAGGALAVAAGAGGLELVSHGVLPGAALLDRLDGACDVPAPPMSFAPAGPAITSSFYSAARGRQVGYTVAYPPGRRPGDRLPLVLVLHGFNGSHAHALAGLSLPKAAALRPVFPAALVAADGGNGYWHAHQGDDPMAMLVDELLPRCRALGLGEPPRTLAALGTSMGGYGALLLAERHPDLLCAVAAISPAVWTSYPQARAANASAFTSAADFAANDLLTHADRLRGLPVRIAAGDQDPFAPGVRALAAALPPGAVVEFSRGCHTGPFFFAQESPSLLFLRSHLVPGSPAGPRQDG